MIKMRLGINYLMLLDKAKRKGFITEKDVRLVYNMPEPKSYYSYKKQVERIRLILRKLIYYGLLYEKTVNISISACWLKNCC